MNRHIYRAVLILGGSREKVGRRWVYKVSPELFLTQGSAMAGVKC